MSTVWSVAKTYPQPAGGFIGISDFEVVNTDYWTNIDTDYKKENMDYGLTGMVVDYLSRFLLNGEDVRKAFDISYKGAKIAETIFGFTNALKIAEILGEIIIDLDDESIRAAYQLAAFDLFYRNPTEIVDYRNLKPSKVTCEHVRYMVMRTHRFFIETSDIKKLGFTFDGGYTEKIGAGDGDILTEDTLWDIKTIKNNPSEAQYLQILMYWIMGQHSTFDCFNNISKIGIYNPRLNKAYICEISKIKEGIIHEIEKNVIGYGQAYAAPVKNTQIATNTFAVIDIETNFMDQVISLGVVIADKTNMHELWSGYYIVNSLYETPSMYGNMLFLENIKEPIIDSRPNIMAIIKNQLEAYGTDRLLAYCGKFDYDRLPELSNYSWCDIADIAAYKQYNEQIPNNISLCATGKIKKGFKVSDMMHYLGEINYTETHNALGDALDELRMVKLLGLDISIYDEAFINRKRPSRREYVHPAKMHPKKPGYYSFEQAYSLLASYGMSKEKIQALVDEGKLSSIKEDGVLYVDSRETISIFNRL
ncbi:hypothetical protein SAMN04487830_11273 [Pseudobutyrivibrio sp. OR37]|uniref:hypothetical protein n=1 Tax=Pseudobutyrivibrio sp. OR37 TaxID=1798186 RepID=UPI0008F35D34|nr:hypothetical protein [Pseudobutyrivibrio sp. OR37]SFH91456.1 hypothetical protein SAMN04487830_11273 [Pseudobutyrivibrio sp. OR37]